jgi:hypothetical protein
VADTVLFVVILECVAFLVLVFIGVLVRIVAQARRNVVLGQLVGAGAVFLAELGSMAYASGSRWSVGMLLASSFDAEDVVDVGLVVASVRGPWGGREQRMRSSVLEDDASTGEVAWR